MKKMVIKSKTGNYNIAFENNFEFFKQFKKINNSIFIVDKNVYDLYTKIFSGVENLYIFDALETNKNINEAMKICEKITELDGKRNSTLVSVGGGIVQDVTGFVSNIMYRGIKWIFIPTTLLSMCDSCIGGKTSLNYKKYKNMLGTFFHPNSIIICPNFIHSLNMKEYYSGLGEVFKFSIMQGVKGIEYIEKNIQNILKKKNETIQKCIVNSLKYKKKIIQIDEYDLNERIVLNFGHTFGHSIEVVSLYKIPHGTSVAIGCIIANHISYKRGYISYDFTKRCENCLLKIIDVNPKFINWDLTLFISAMHKDKKQINKLLSVVLLINDEGKLKLFRDLRESEVKEAIKYFGDLYKKNEN